MGARIAAQLAKVISSPSYAKDLGIAPSIELSGTEGVVFHCGCYEARLANHNRKGVLWVYFGSQGTFQLSTTFGIFRRSSCHAGFSTDVHFGGE